MQSKKYFSISEVTSLLQVPAHKLRYLEKILKKLNVIKIKGRRYYTNSNIEFLQQSLKVEGAISEPSAIPASSVTPALAGIHENLPLFSVRNSHSHLPSLNTRIDELIHKFSNLADDIRRSIS